MDLHGLATPWHHPGIMQAGGCYLPLDPSFPDDRLAIYLADSGAAAVILTHDNLQRAQQLSDGAQTWQVLHCMHALPCPAHRLKFDRVTVQLQTTSSRWTVHLLTCSSRALAGLEGHTEIWPLANLPMQAVCIEQCWGEHTPDQEEDLPQVRVDAASPAYIIFTSGSTGRYWP